MKVANIFILNLILLTTLPVFAQSLPDEINYPYYEKIKDQDALTLQADLKAYDGTVQARMSTEEAITSNQTQIQQQQSGLSQDQSELNRRNQDQDILEGNISQTDAQLSRATSDYNREFTLWQNYDRDYQNVLRVYQPINARYENQKVRLEKEEQLHRRLELDVRQDSIVLAELEKKLGTIPSDIAQSKQEVARLKSRIANLGQSSTTLNIKVNDLKQKISKDDARLTEVKQTLTGINKEISLLTRQIENSRQNGIDPAEIKKMEDSLATKTKEREDINTEKRKLEVALSPFKDDLLKAEAELNVTQTNLNDSQRSLVSEEKSLERLIFEESQIAAQIQKATQDLARSTTTLKQVDQNLANYRREFNSTEREWRDTVELVNLRQRDLEIQVQRVTNIQQSKDNLQRDLAQLVQSSNQNISVMNNLNGQIKTTQQALNRLSSDLNTLTTNLATLKKEEVSNLANANKSQTRFNASNTAFENRLVLYEKYEDAAISLGQSEVSNIAASAGDKAGLNLGTILANKVAQDLGTELGTVQGKLWANIRAEGQGYNTGYSNGKKSPIDNERAKLEGEKKGEQAANQYLEQVLRPKYFVQFLEELIEKEEVQSSNESKVAGMTSSVKSSLVDTGMEKNLAAKINQDPEVLTAEEIALAQKFKTSLDSLIAQGGNESRTLENKAIQLENYLQVYQTPSTIPYGKIKCSSVYKNLQVFKNVCSLAYSSLFKDDFLKAHENSFAEAYTNDYKKHLSQKQILNRTQAYAATFSNSYKLAQNEGFKIGTDETFQEAVTEQYDLAYAEAIKAGDVALRDKIIQEVKEHVQKNATLGLVSADLDQKTYMPGSMGKILIVLKNISPKAFAGAVSMKITKAENVQVASNSSVLQSLEALSKGTIPSIEYKISANAKAGSYLIIEGIIDLPGDVHRSVRTVKFQIKKLLGKNLVPELAVDYDETPKIKTIFGINKHSVKISLTPKHDAVLKGYRVVLTALNDSAPMIEFKQQEAITKGLNIGEKIDVKLGYKLTRQAKGKTLMMTCDIYSESILIEQKLLKLNAH